MSNGESAGRARQIEQLKAMANALYIGGSMALPCRVCDRYSALLGTTELHGALLRAAEALAGQETKCRYCDAEIRFIDGAWLDRETHSTCETEPGLSLKHAPPAQERAGLAKLNLRDEAKRLAQGGHCDHLYACDCLELAIFESLTAAEALAGQEEAPQPELDNHHNALTCPTTDATLSL